MFLGTYEPKMDAKGRVILPAKFRDQLADGLVVTAGQEHCVYVYTEADFAAMAETLRKAPTTSRPAREYMRVLFSSAEDVELDKQGRITIPSRLRTYADLGRDLVVIGAGTRAEIWQAEAWHDYLAVQEEQFAQMAEEVVPGMF